VGDASEKTNYLRVQQGTLRSAPSAAARSSAQQMAAGVRKESWRMRIETERAYTGCIR
jgi:hypothetical protein